MIDEGLKIGFNAGRNTLEQNAEFFHKMTEEEMHGFSDEVFNVLTDGVKSRFIIRDAHKTRDNIISSWIWVHNGFDLEKSPLYRCG